jgi:DNA-binding NarL/FixJ family response regulator
LDLQPRSPRFELPDDIHRQDKSESLIYVDDRALTRDSVANQLAIWLPEFSVVPIGSPDEIGVLTFDGRACSILYYIHSLRVESMEVLRSLSVMQKMTPELRINLLSDLDRRENIIAALRHGVSGYLLTSLSLKIASEIIRLVHVGGTFIPAGALLDTRGISPPEKIPPSPTPELSGFTRRQIEVLSQLREGKQNKAIAFELNMAESTVKVHLQHLMRKLQANNRMEVVARTQHLFEDGQRAGGRETSTAKHWADDRDVAASWPIGAAAPDATLPLYVKRHAFRTG